MLFRGLATSRLQRLAFYRPLVSVAATAAAPPGVRFCATAPSPPTTGTATATGAGSSTASTSTPESPASGGWSQVPTKPAGRAINAANVLTAVHSDAGETAAYYATRYFGGAKYEVRVNHLLMGELKRQGYVTVDRGTEPGAPLLFYPARTQPQRGPRVTIYRAEDNDLSVLADEAAKVEQQQPGAAAPSGASRTSPAGSSATLSEADAGAAAMAAWGQPASGPGAASSQSGDAWAPERVRAYSRRSGAQGASRGTARADTDEMWAGGASRRDLTWAREEAAWFRPKRRGPPPSPSATAPAAPGAS